MSNSFPSFDRNQPAKYPVSNKGAANPAPARRAFDLQPTWRFATFSVVVSVSSIALTGLAIFVHFMVRAAEVPWWWILLLVLLLIALALLGAAAHYLPSQSSQERNWGNQRLAKCFAIWLAAVTCYALAFLPMSFILYIKSPAGQQAVTQSRMQQKLLQQQQATAARQQAILEQQYQRELEALGNQISFAQRSVSQVDQMEASLHTRIAAAEAKQAEDEQVRKKVEYRTAVYDRLAKFDSGQPLPKYNGEKLDWSSATPVKFNRATFASDATPTPLIEDQQAAAGMQVWRLKLVGAEFIPKLAMFPGKKKDQPLLVLVRRSGDELLITTADWTLQRTTYFGGKCVDLAYSQQTLLVAQEVPGAVVSAIKNENGSGYYSSGRFLAPQQITGSRRNGHEITTGTSTPLWCSWSEGFIRQIQELSHAREPAATSRFLPSQLGRQTFVSTERKIFVAQKDGIYSGQLAPTDAPQQRPYLASDIYGGHLSLDGRRFLLHEHEWPIPEIAWTKVVPAAGIDVEKFATIGGDYLATCNDTHNLLLYDTTGKLHSQHTWPGAGKTLGLAGMLDSPHLLVFTEQKVFVVTPADAKVGNQVATADVPQVPTVKPPTVKVTPDQPGRPFGLPPFIPLIGKQGLAKAELTTKTEKVSIGAAGTAYTVAGGEGWYANVFPATKVKWWTWGEDDRDQNDRHRNDRYQFGVSGSLFYRISSSRVNRQIDFAIESSRKIPATEDYFSHFALSKSRVVAIVPESRQLVTADRQNFEFANSFQIPEFTAKNGRLATSQQVDWVVLTQESKGSPRLDLIDVRDGRLLLSIPGAELQPPVTQFEQVVIGPHNSLGVCTNRHFYWLQLTGASFRQFYAMPLKEMSAVRLHPVAAKNMIYAIDGTALRRFEYSGNGPADCELKVPRPLNIAIDPSGDFYWSDEVKKYDLAGGVAMSIPLKEPGGMVTLTPDCKQIVVGNQLIVIFSR